MKNIYKIIILLLIHSISFGQGKTSDEKKAEKDYQKFAYVNAIKTYERMYAKGFKSADLFKKLANSYYFNGDLINASKWYTELFATPDAVIEPEYYYRYSQALKSTKDYEKADAMTAKFIEISGGDTRARRLLKQKDYLAVIKQNSGRSTIFPLDINSKFSDFGSAFTGNKLIFATGRDKQGKKDKWTGETFSTLFKTNLNTDGKFSEPTRLSPKPNGGYNESTVSYSKDGKTVFFTRNNYLNGKFGNDQSKTRLLKIYKADVVNDDYVNVVELPFNSDLYQVAHPALSSDEKILYFASNMPGSLGQSDLYKVEILGNNKYSKPENLGPAINTEGRETFPFISETGELYFASDGQPGLGGLDIYITKPETDGTFQECLNIGEPLNSSQDDFAFVINGQTREGYITSNRDGGKGSDDIYKFVENKKIEYRCVQLLAGIIKDKDTGLPIKGAIVKLSDSNFKVIKEATTLEDGKFDFGEVYCDTKYYIKSSFQDYETKEQVVEKGKTFVPLALEKSIKKLTIGGDLGSALGIQFIYFDIGKSQIRKDAIIELAKILDLLKEYPSMEIDVRSHTDSRGSSESNLSLSDKRVKASIEWLIKQGIAKTRLTGKGYGESEPVNNCIDGVKCSDEDYQANRRSEFIITKM